MNSKERKLELSYFLTRGLNLKLIPWSIFGFSVDLSSKHDVMLVPNPLINIAVSTILMLMLRLNWLICWLSFDDFLLMRWFLVSLSVDNSICNNWMIILVFLLADFWKVITRTWASSLFRNSQSIFEIWARGGLLEYLLFMRGNQIHSLSHLICICNHDLIIDFLLLHKILMQKSQLISSWFKFILKGLILFRFL